LRKYSLVLFALISIIYSGCGDTDINSVWRKQNIVIDGNDNDWDSTLVSSTDIKASLGVCNDNNYLYICFSTDDPEVESKILMSGLTLWFRGNDDTGGRFGIRYPMGIKDSDMLPFDENIKPGIRPVRPRKIHGSLLKDQTELEIINTDGNRITIPVSELKDIKLKMAMDEDKLVYELRVPLNQKSSTTYALNANPGSMISLGIESGINSKNSFPPPSNGFGMPGGGGEGSIGEPYDGSGGGPLPSGGMGREMFLSQPIDLQVNIKLASIN
jgi:hypothetical protein